MSARISARLLIISASLCSLVSLVACSDDSAPANSNPATIRNAIDTTRVQVRADSVAGDSTRGDSLHGAPVTEVLAATAVLEATRGATLTKASPAASATKASPIAPVVRAPASKAPETISPATDAELAALHAVIGMPVVGLRPADLRDTYLEARTGHTHEALDIPAPRGTPVVSAAAGKLLKIFESKAGGHMIYAADESDRFILMYAHLDRYADGLKEGMPLVRGQALGYVGTTGNAPPNVPHLHFAISRGTPSRKWWSGVPINPYPLLAR